jgi:flagellar motor switch protein FliM
MTSVLTQVEIDQLLAAINLEEDCREDQSNCKDSRKIRIHDFKRPDKFTKENIRSFSTIHETFARLFNTFLSDYLKTQTNIHVASVDQLTYEEFIRSISTPTTLSVINLDPLQGSAVMEIDPAVTFAIISRLFGGGEVIKCQHELTDLERFVMKGIIVSSFERLREAWEGIIDLRPRLGAIDTNPQFAQIVPYYEMVALITLEAKIGDVEGMINLCYPYQAVAPILGRLTEQYRYSGVEPKKSLPESDINEVLDKVKIPLTVVLGKKSFPLKEIREMKEGKILELDRLAGEPLDIFAGNELIGRGEAVVIDEYFGIRVTETGGKNV